MKKVCVFLIVFIMSFFEFAAFAYEYDFLSAAEAVRQKIDIPDNYTDFNSYVDVGDSVNYVLSWSGGNSNDGGVITVVTDVLDRIIALSQYRYGKYKGNYKLSSIDYNEACSIAEQYIKKIAPEFADKLVIFKQPNYIAKNNESYTVLFYRNEGGLPCYDNYALVLIDAYTKQVSEYRAVWEDYARISPQSSYISKEQALKIFNNEIGTELAYSKADGEIKLVYSTNADGTRFVSAYNGEIIKTNMPAYPSADNYIKKTYFEDGLTAMYDSSLTLPAFTNDKVKNNSYLGISADYEIESTRFFVDDAENVFAKIVYNNYDNMPITVTVNTKNTEIVGFNAPRTITDNSKMLSDSACFKIAKGFAYQHIGSIYKHCRTYEKISTDDGNIYRIKFLFKVNGIPYSDNGIIIDIDRADGRVVAVNAKMDTNTEFPLSIPDVSYDKAYEVLVNEIGFELQYVPVMTDSGKELRIVYSFTPTYPVYVCANTGNACDADGNIYSKPEEKVYNDISGNNSEKQINTVVLADIMTFEGESFLPDTNITAYEFAQIIYNIFGKTLEFDDYSRYITHEEAVEKLIAALGYEDIAYLDDTYTSSFIDSAFITPSRTGSAEIAKGLGIIKGNAFLPKKYVTRAYCAELIYNTITERNDLNEG